MPVLALQAGFFEAGSQARLAVRQLGSLTGVALAAVVHSNAIGGGDARQALIHLVRDVAVEADEDVGDGFFELNQPDLLAIDVPLGGVLPEVALVEILGKRQPELALSQAVAAQIRLQLVHVDVGERLGQPAMLLVRQPIAEVLLAEICVGE